MRLRILIAAFLLCASAPGLAQDATEQKRIDAERRALEAERRAVDAERRAVEAERRTQATQGASQPPPPPPPDAGLRREACRAAMANYQTSCARPNVDPLWETPQCMDAKKLVADQCK